MTPTFMYGNNQVQDNCGWLINDWWLVWAVTSMTTFDKEGNKLDIDGMTGLTFSTRRKWSITGKTWAGEQR